MFLDRNPEYFLTIASERSISKAAERLHISQPYLSQYVIHLEGEFGIKLLDRKNAPLQLTPAGEIYAQYLASCSQLYEKLLLDFTNLNASRIRSVRIAMSNWRASTLLPDILPLFTSRHPDVRLELFEQPTSELYRLVWDNKVDFAIMNTSTDMPPQLTAETIFHENILLVGNRNNPAAEKLRQLAQDRLPPDLSLLEHEQMILLRPELVLAMRVNNYLEHMHVILHNVIYSSNATTALNLTAGNYGFCFANETAIHSAPNRKELLFFHLNSPDLVHPLCVVYKKGSYLLPVARAFIDTASQFYRSFAWHSEYDCQF